MSHETDHVTRAPAGPAVPVLRCAAVVVLGAAVLSGCTSANEDVPVPTPTPTEQSTEAASYDLCAEFPPVASSGHDDLEGWWSATPANPDGSIIEDPAAWPDRRMVRHPRTAVVDVESGEVLSTWDRTTCTDDPAFVPVPDDQWPAVTDDARELVVVDMDTNEVVSTSIVPY